MEKPQPKKTNQTQTTMSKNNKKGLFSGIADKLGISQKEETNPETQNESAPVAESETHATEQRTEKKPKPATSYSEMLKQKAADRKQRALKFRKNGEAEN